MLCMNGFLLSKISLLRFFAEFSRRPNSNPKNNQIAVGKGTLNNGL